MSTIDSWWNYSKDYFDILSAAPVATTLSQLTFFEISRTIFDQIEEIKNEQ